MKNLFIAFFTVSIVCSSAQVKTGASYKDYFQEGSYLLLEDNFSLAKDNFESAYRIDSSSANINYMMGIVTLKTPNHKENAEYYLAKAVKHISKTYKSDTYTEKAAPPLAHYYYAKALHLNGKFDEAIAEFNEFGKHVSQKDKDWKKMLDHEKEMAVYAKEKVAAPINIQITNLGDSINTQYPEYSPVISADERMLIYTTRRPNTVGGGKDIDGMYYEDVVVAYKDDEGRWSSPKSLSPNVNSSGHEASINLTPDGQTLIVYKGIGDKDGNIYYSTFDGKDWSTLKEFGSDVNTKHWESHACLNADQTVLFFSSNRPGGYGGKDIYRCIKLPNGKWSKALNMGPTINTEYDEDGAFIHPDGKTFFFASNGHKSIGGYDIMFAILNEDNKFTDVENLGYPINTTDDDVFYIASPDGKRGYLSSAREGGFGDKDIYMVSIPEAKEKPLALFKGQIIPAEGEKLPEDLTIIVKDKKTGEVIGTYRPKIVNGTFSTILPPGREYNFSYQAPPGEEFYNEDVFVSNDLTYNEIKREVNLEPVKLLGKIKSKNSKILLNAIVLNNSRTKKSVSNSKLVLAEAGGSEQNFTSNEKGQCNNIELQPDKKYTLVAENEGKKSAVANINTSGLKSGRVINQILYLDGSSAKTQKDMLLNVVVKNQKTKQKYNNAQVTVTDADGNKTDYTTNEKGEVNGIELAPDTKYTVSAIVDGNASENIVVTTGKSGKLYAKTLLIGDDKIGNEPAQLSANQYAFYFKYNKNDNDESEQQWTTFINKVVELSNRKQGVTINILASASKVPTRTFKKNSILARSRAKNLQDKIKLAIEQKGVDAKKVHFVKKSIVAGPRYRGDLDLGREKYEKHQFVKANAR
ncbi:MAG: PD40 domain-containing protein [Bacteroidetes bacterium]|nr:PD40 domain-containing protein [Bacteroidota bacterium]